MTETESQKIVDQAIASRRSIRAFLPTPVDRADIEAILQVAARAPSGSNTQPWKVYVLTGARKQRLTERLVPAFLDPAQASENREEFRYYPEKWESPFLERRRKVGWDLYSLLGLGREDKEAMRQQHARNFRFFDAPVGMIFTMDRSLERGSLLVLYSDGLVERRDRGLREGIAALAQALSDTPADASAQQVCDALRTSLVDGYQEDDVCLLVVRVP